MVEQLVRMAGLELALIPVRCPPFSLEIVFFPACTHSMQSCSPGGTYIESLCGELTGSYVADSSDLSA